MLLTDARKGQRVRLNKDLVYQIPAGWFPWEDPVPAGTRAVVTETNCVASDEDSGWLAVRYESHSCDYLVKPEDVELVEEPVGSK